jgi:hypothetical protein
MNLPGDVERRHEAPRGSPKCQRPAAPAPTPLVWELLAVCFWLVTSSATLACLAFLGHTLIEDFPERHVFTPEVKQAREDWLVHNKPDGEKRYQDALDKARQWMSQDQERTKARVYAGAAGAGVAGLLTAVAFLVLLGVSGLRCAYRIYVLCLLTPLLAVVGLGVGVALAVGARHEAYSTPEIQQLRAPRRRDHGKPFAAT